MLKTVADLQTLSEDQFQLLRVIHQEYQTGMLALNSLGPNTATIYGGSLVKEEDLAYIGIVKASELLAKRGYNIVSGGGPGIMTAAINGARKGGGKAIAFCIDIPGEPPAPNTHVQMTLTQFSVRKYLLRQSDIFVFAPGGLGTLDELMEILTLIKTGKFPKKPIFLYDRSFWEGYIDWFRQILLNERKVVMADFLTLFNIVNSPEEIIFHLFNE